VKKYLIPAIVLGAVGLGILLRYAIVAPARAAARDLNAINGLSIGQSESELLGRSAFQKEDYHCFGGEVCMYSSLETNKLLSAVHLAPPMVLSTAVLVRDGAVVQVYFYVMQKGMEPISVTQTAKMPDGCSVSPCVVPHPKFIKSLKDMRIMFTNESEYRNRFPEMVDTTCLSRIGGCKSYAELVPFTKIVDLNVGHP
jgi:hypothetical protein